MCDAVNTRLDASMSKTGQTFMDSRLDVGVLLSTPLPQHNGPNSRWTTADIE